LRRGDVANNVVVFFCFSGRCKDLFTSRCNHAGLWSQCLLHKIMLKYYTLKLKMLFYNSCISDLRHTGVADNAVVFSC
jgi:hypothetical protein